jgi:ubiquinone/menaquinone biosynthesis C-methylase UbiE
MSAQNPPSPYVLGGTDAEQDRLIWQAQRANPPTERLFREAGICTGMRVLDIGSGVGDVAMLAARLVGPTGQVVGIERNPHSLARARARVAAAGFLNVSFVEADIFRIPEMSPFDAAVGRFVLMFLPDPVAALRSVAKLVRPGGLVAFQEPYWVPVLHLLSPLPLWAAAARLIHETFVRSGVNPEIGPALHSIFQEAGLPAPMLRLEMPLGKDPDIAEWYCGLLRTLLPEVQRVGLDVSCVGNLDTLKERMQEEVEASKTLVAWLAPVGVWSRKT